jgi:hypothetical protein
MPVVVEGYKELIQKLNAFEPDLNKQMKIEITAAMLPIRDKARGYAPSSYPSYLYNWADKGIVRAQPQFNTEGRVRKFPLYNPAEVIAGIKYKAGANKKDKYGFSALYSVTNNSPAGVIYEWAGRTSGYRGQPWVGPKGQGKDVSRSRNPNAGAIFINSMGPMYGKGMMRGRLIYRAWNEDQGKAQDAVIHAIEKAARRFNERATQSAFGLVA